MTSSVMPPRFSAALTVFTRKNELLKDSPKHLWVDGNFGIAL